MKVKMRKSQSQIFFGNTLCQQLILTALDPHLELLSPTLDKEDNISQIFLKNTISEFKLQRLKSFDCRSKTEFVMKRKTLHDVTWRHRIKIWSQPDMELLRTFILSKSFLYSIKLNLRIFKSFTTLCLCINSN